MSQKQERDMKQGNSQRAKKTDLLQIAPLFVAMLVGCVNNDETKSPTNQQDGGAAVVFSFSDNDTLSAVEAYDRLPEYNRGSISSDTPRNNLVRILIKNEETKRFAVNRIMLPGERAEFSLDPGKYVFKYFSINDTYVFKRQSVGDIVVCPAARSALGAEAVDESGSSVRIGTKRAELKLGDNEVLIEARPPQTETVIDLTKAPDKSLTIDPVSGTVATSRQITPAETWFECPEGIVVRDYVKNQALFDILEGTGGAEVPTDTSRQRLLFDLFEPLGVATPVPLSTATPTPTQTATTDAPPTPAPTAFPEAVATAAPLPSPTPHPVIGAEPNVMGTVPEMFPERSFEFSASSQSIDLTAPWGVEAKAYLPGQIRVTGTLGGLLWNSTPSVMGELSNPFFETWNSPMFGLFPAYAGWGVFSALDGGTDEASTNKALFVPASVNGLSSAGIIYSVSFPKWTGSLPDKISVQVRGSDATVVASEDFRIGTKGAPICEVDVALNPISAELPSTALEACAVHKFGKLTVYFRAPRPLPGYASYDVTLYAPYDAPSNSSSQLAWARLKVQGRMPLQGAARTKLYVHQVRVDQSYFQAQSGYEHEQNITLTVPALASPREVEIWISGQVLNAQCTISDFDPDDAFSISRGMAYIPPKIFGFGYSYTRSAANMFPFLPVAPFVTYEGTTGAWDSQMPFVTFLNPWQVSGASVCRSGAMPPFRNVSLSATVGDPNVESHPNIISIQRTIPPLGVGQLHCIGYGAINHDNPHSAEESDKKVCFIGQ